MRLVRVRSIRQNMISVVLISVHRMGRMWWLDSILIMKDSLKASFISSRLHPRSCLISWQMLIGLRSIMLKCAALKGTLLVLMLDYVVGTCWPMLSID